MILNQKTQGEFETRETEKKFRAIASEIEKYPLQVISSALNVIRGAYTSGKQIPLTDEQLEKLTMFRDDIENIIGAGNAERRTTIERK